MTQTLKVDLTETITIEIPSDINMDEHVLVDYDDKIEVRHVDTDNLVFKIHRYNIIADSCTVEYNIISKD